MIAHPYTAADAAAWNDFVDRSKNGTFLLRRGYMDYHADRFTDASLIVEREDGGIACLFAASAHGATVKAHGGLTYGGMIMPRSHFDGADVLEAFRLILDHYRQQGGRRLLYRAIPGIYHSEPAQEDLYALFRHGAVIEACGLSSAIALDAPPRFNENSRRNLRRALAAGVTVGPDTAYDEFWPILAGVLAGRHGVAPVHSLDEMLLLAARFPDNIRLYTARDAGGALVAGTVVYLTPRVAHVQYIAASPRGRELRVLPALFDGAIAATGPGRGFFDFGISTEQGGMELNEGLHHSKYALGGRGVVYQVFSLAL